MKRVLLGAALVVLFVSCAKSPEEKAKSLIEDDIKKVLYHPESYDPAETLVDSAFAPFDDPVFYEKTLRLCKLGMAIDRCNENMKDAKSSMSIWSGPYQSAFGRNSYQEAKDKYDNNAQEKINEEIKAKKLGNELKGMIDKGRKFIGFKVQHSYRANTNSGQTVFGKKLYLFDENMERIIASYDMDDVEYQTVQFFYGQFLGDDVVESEDF